MSSSSLVSTAFPTSPKSLTVPRTTLTSSVSAMELPHPSTDRKAQVFFGSLMFKTPISRSTMLSLRMDTSTSSETSQSSASQSSAGQCLAMAWRISVPQLATSTVLARLTSTLLTVLLQLTLEQPTSRMLQVLRQSIVPRCSISLLPTLVLATRRITTSPRRPVCHCPCQQEISFNSRRSSLPRVLVAWAEWSIS